MKRNTFIAGLGLACAALTWSGSASGATIQPILVNVTSLPGGTFAYTYDLQLTPNNGLSANAAFPSSLTVADFGTIVGTPTLVSTAGDATAASDWVVSVK